MTRRSLLWLGLYFIVAFGTALIALRFFRLQPTAEPVAEPAPAVVEPVVELPQEPPLPPRAIARLGSAAFRGFANSLAFAPDGDSFFTCAWTGVRQIDVKTGRVVHEYRSAARPGEFLDFKVTRDGRYLIEKETHEGISFDEGKFATLRIREWPGGKIVSETQTFGGSLIVSTDGTKVAVVEYQGFGVSRSIGVVDVPDGVFTRVQLNEDRYLANAVFRPGSPELLVVDWCYGKGLEHTDGRIRRFRLSGRNPTEVGSFQFAGNEERTRLAVSADGRLLAAIAFRDLIRRQPGQTPKFDIVQDGRLQFWDISRGERIAHPELGHEKVWHLSFLPDGSLLTVGSADGNGIARVWEGPDWRNTIAWTLRNWRAGQVAVSPDGKTLVVSSQSGHIRRFDIPSGNEHPSRPTHSAEITEIAFAEHGTMITWSKELTWSTEPLAWDVATGTTREVPASAQRPGSEPGAKLEDPPPDGAHVVREPRGRYVAAAWGEWDKPKSVAVWDEPSRRRLWRAEFRPGVYPMGFSPNGQQLYLNDRAFVAVDAATGREDFRWDLVERGVVTKNGMSSCGVWVVSGGKQLLLRTYFDGLRLLDAHSGTLRHKLTPHAREPIAISSDGRMVAATLSGDSATVAVWDADTGECRETFVTDHFRVTVLAFDEAGRRLVTGGTEGTALVWNLAPN